MKTYGWSEKQWEQMHASEDKVRDRREFPRWAREHMNQRVGVYYMKKRGNYRRYTRMGFAYGRLVQSEKPDVYTLQGPDGTTHSIHYSRIQAIYSQEKVSS